MKELEKKGSILWVRISEGDDFERELIVAVRYVAINRIWRIIRIFFSNAEHVVWKVDHMMVVHKSLNLSWISLCFDNQPQKDSIFHLVLNLDVKWLLFGSKTAENSSVQNRPGLNIAVNRIYLFLDAIEKVHLVVNKVNIFLRLKNLKILVRKFWIKCLKVVELITSHHYTNNPLKKCSTNMSANTYQLHLENRRPEMWSKIQNFRRVLY